MRQGCVKYPNNNHDDDCPILPGPFPIIIGQTGPTGPTGEAGPAPTLAIGTVTTGAPGTEASATITGMSPNFVLNLTIPQGPTGETGGNETA